MESEFAHVLVTYLGWVIAGLGGVINGFLWLRIKKLDKEHEQSQLATDKQINSQTEIFKTEIHAVKSWAEEVVRDVIKDVTEVKKGAEHIVRRIEVFEKEYLIKHSELKDLETKMAQMETRIVDRIGKLSEHVAAAIGTKLPLHRTTD